MEINATLNEVKQAHDGVAKWAKTESAPFSLNFAAMKPVIRKEPKGTVLIISPFNYPLWLSFGPLVCPFGFLDVIKDAYSCRYFDRRALLLPGILQSSNPLKYHPLLAR